MRATFIEGIACPADEAPSIAAAFSVTSGKEETSNGEGEASAVEAAHYVGLWLRYRGPIAREDVHQALAPLTNRADLDRILDSLVQDQRTIEGRLRARRSTEIETRPLKHLALDLARHQGLLDELRGFEGLLHDLESLGALPIAAELW